MERIRLLLVKKRGPKRVVRVDLAADGCWRPAIGAA